MYGITPGFFPILYTILLTLCYAILMVTWVTKRKRRPKRDRQRKREAEEADKKKVEVAQTKGFQKRRQLRR